MLELKNIYKKTGKDEFSLKNVNLSFQSSGLYLIVGENGQNNTELLNLIGGMDLATSGYIFFNGMELTKRNIDAYRNSNVGYVSKSLISSFSLRENLRLAFDLLHEEMTQERIQKAFEFVGLPDNGMSTDEFLDLMPNNLSVMQSFCFAVARALIKEPKITLFEEPSDFFDEEQAKGILCLLKKLSKISLVIVHSQNMLPLSHEFDNIIQIIDGTVSLKEEKQIATENETNHSYRQRIGIFSFFETLRISLIDFKNKKIRLISSFIISIITGFLLGLVCLFQTCNKTDALLKTQLKNGMNGAFIQKMYTFHDHSTIFEKRSVIEYDDNQIKTIKEYTEGKCFPVWSFNLSLFNDNYLYGPSGEIESYVRQSFGRYVEVPSNVSPDDMGLSRYEGLSKDVISRLPINSNEVAISSLFAEYLVRYGFYDSNQKDSSPIQIDKMEDLIGYKTHSGLTIVGIFSTDDGQCDLLKSYFGKSQDEFDKLNDNKYIRSMLKGTSLATFVYIGEGYHEKTINKSYTDRPVSFYVRLKGKYDKDSAFLSSLTKKPYYIDLESCYSGYADFVDGFYGKTRFVSWFSACLLLVISFFMTLWLFLENGRSTKNNLWFLQSMGSSKMALSLVILLQSSLMILSEFLTSLVGLAVLSIIVNICHSIAIFSLNSFSIFLLLLSFAVINLMASFFSFRKLNKPIDHDKDSDGMFKLMD